MTDLHMTAERAEAYRIAAAELLTEANTRGDQDDPTIAFAVGFLLRRANSELPKTLVKFDQGGRITPAPCGHCSGSGLVQGRYVGQPIPCPLCNGSGSTPARTAAREAAREDEG